MRIPLSWLKEFIEIKESPQEIADLLTLAGIEVEGIEHKPLPFTKVVTAKILSIRPHPDADRLRITTATIGQEDLQIVTADQTCKEEQITALALIGATLKDASGNISKIKKGKLRGVESQGMFCSAAELGLAKHAASIYAFPTDTPLGMDLEEFFSDVIFEISLTPNLGHCQSIYGIARELSALLKRPIKEEKMKELKAQKTPHSITITEPAFCMHYGALLIKDIQVQPSPFWLSSKLELVGIRPINNIVDIANYVMMEYGQPLHTFDANKLEGNSISVTFSKKKLEVVTLDGETRHLPIGIPLICDAKKPIALAGIMGLANSEIEDSSTSVLIEGAAFDSHQIRKASKTLQLRTDASARFEKGIDIENVNFCILKAAEMICEMTNGNACTLIEKRGETPPPLSLPCKLAKIKQILGLHLSIGEVEELLHLLSFQTKKVSDQELQVTPPSFRNDVHEEIDLIEEVARLYGYNNIPRRPPLVTLSSLNHDPLYIFEKKLRTKLISLGLQEFLTCDLISPELAKIGLEQNCTSNNLIHVLHPSSIEQSVLRLSLLPGLLQCIKRNIDQKNASHALFEIGRIHFAEEKQFQERYTAGILLTGNQTKDYHDPKPRLFDFFDLKGNVESLFESLSLQGEIRFLPSGYETFHPNQQAEIKIGDSILGVLGAVHPKHAQKFDLTVPAFFAQLDIEEMLLHQNTQLKMHPLPQYPESDRDWTLPVKQELPMQKLYDAITAHAPKFLKKIELIDLYIPNSKQKNITIRLIYRNDQKTITQEQVEENHLMLQKKIQHELSDFLCETKVF